MFVSNGGCHAKRLKGLSEIHNEIHSGICPSVPGPGAHRREDLSATAQRNQGRGTEGSDRLRRLRVPLSRCQRPTCDPRWAEKRAVARRKRGPPRGPNPSRALVAFARGGRRLSVERVQQCAGQVTTTAVILHERVRRADLDDIIRGLGRGCGVVGRHKSPHGPPDLIHFVEVPHAPAEAVAIETLPSSTSTQWGHPPSLDLHCTSVFPRRVHEQSAERMLCSR
jgi:hypothetical protein